MKVVAVAVFVIGAFLTLANSAGAGTAPGAGTAWVLHYVGIVVAVLGGLWFLVSLIPVKPVVKPPEFGADQPPVVPQREQD